ncbi:MMPL family transporter, partial [Porticoccus sp.]
MTISTLMIIAVAAVPSVWPEKFPQLHHITVDTDPENMLSQDEPVRALHHEAKERFGLSDIVVVGIINHQHEQGVFNAESLKRIYQLTEFSKRLQWDGEGVISIDLIAPSTVDNIEQGGLGSVNFSWLMQTPPKTDEAALKVLQRAQNIPFLNGTLVSEDGQALALYLPITQKDLSYRIRSELLDFTRDWADYGDEVHITGLPVAEDTFGVEMFIQMAISAPLAMLVIFLLLWWFFKKLILVVSPMIIAMVSSLATMGLLIATDNTIHIMSSMIPIFIMPIAVLDAVHILSEFFDRYPVYKDRRKAVEEVMNTLFAPMLFTTLTTMAGFGS